MPVKYFRISMRTHTTSLMIMTKSVKQLGACARRRVLRVKTGGPPIASLTIARMVNAARGRATATLLVRIQFQGRFDTASLIGNLPLPVIDWGRGPRF